MDDHGARCAYSLKHIAASEISGNTGRMNDSTRLSRPRDPNQLAKLIADIATGEQVDRPMTDDGRDVAAVLMGRLGGLKGGRARADALSAERRSEIAQQAAAARWAKGTR